MSCWFLSTKLEKVADINRTYSITAYPWGWVSGVKCLLLYYLIFHGYCLAEYFCQTLFSMISDGNIIEALLYHCI